jgi:hypothetical protein
MKGWIGLAWIMLAGLILESGEWWLGGAFAFDALLLLLVSAYQYVREENKKGK